MHIPRLRTVIGIPIAKNFQKFISCPILSAFSAMMIFAAEPINVALPANVELAASASHNEVFCNGTISPKSITLGTLLTRLDNNADRTLRFTTSKDDDPDHEKK